MNPADPTRGGLYVMSVGVHGLVRGTNIELGRDPDTGGQTSYMVDQARAVSARPGVDSVDLVTRLIDVQRIDDSYATPREPLSDRAQIIRIPFGPRRYLRKENLWPYLDGMRDELIRYIRSRQRPPDIIHGHYADAGYVGAQLAKLLGVPFVFTGHSLGRVKKARLLAKGADADTLEERYHFTQRVEAEERALETAALVIASTHQEVEEQYRRYDHYEPERMEVIPPGVDLSRFSPPTTDWPDPPVARELARFLRDPEKPMILAVARPDERKNFPGLLRAFGATPELRERANLILVAGTRRELDEMPAASRRVLYEILKLIDDYDLYGRVAYPKTVAQKDVADVYRLAARSRGVFVNPAFTEPFGLTLIEAAASGLPIVATNDGGPNDIVAECRNGLLVDPTDETAIGQALTEAVRSTQWQQWARHGVEAAHRHYSWEAHAEKYVAELGEVAKGVRAGYDFAVMKRSRLPGVDRLLISDIDNTLTGDDEALRALVARLADTGDEVGFAIATGRTLKRAQRVIEQKRLPTPDLIIASSGTEVYYGSDLTTHDASWERQIDYQWFPEEIKAALHEVPGLKLQGPTHQGRFRVSYDIDPASAPSLAELRRELRQAGLRVSVILDHGKHLDILPMRAGPGNAIRFLCYKWDLPPDRLLVAGDSGNDAGMLSGHTLGVVVANYSRELEYLKGRPRIYFAEGAHAWGVLEGIDHYDFFGTIRVPEDVTA